MGRVYCLHLNAWTTATADVQFCRLCDVFVSDHGCELDNTPVVESVVGEIKRFQVWEETELDFVNELEESFVLNAIDSL